MRSQRFGARTEKRKPRPCSGTWYPRVRDFDRNESVLATSTTRNQRRHDAGVGKFRPALLCVFFLGIVLPSGATPTAPRSSQKHIGVLFLSSEDPDLPDVAT